MPPNLKQLINHAYLENGTSGQIVSHLEKKLDVNGFKAPDERQINTVTQQATKPNPEKPKSTCHHYRDQCRQLKKARDQTDTNKNGAGNNNNSNNNRLQTNCNPHYNKNASNETRPLTVIASNSSKNEIINSISIIAILFK